MLDRLDLAPYIALVERLEPWRWTGKVVEVVGLLVESAGPAAAVGDFCEIRGAGGRRIRTQVIGFRNGHVLSMPLEETGGLELGNPIVARREEARIGVGPELIGRVLDGFGEPMDGGPPLELKESYDIISAPPGPMEREHVTEPLITGIRAIDSLLPVGRGQRIGVFGGSGVGKSTLLGAMSRHNSADVTVIALVGERNREVRAFIEHEMGPEGMRRAVVVAATSDRPAPLRVRASFVATAIAEYFRDQGAHVLLVMDSVTRLAMAQREIGLAAGEPPSQKGYTPSVFNLLPKLFERAGRFRRGSITGFYTVLVEGDDITEPIADAVRATIDGHIVLSRHLAAMGHYPAIDILNSVSRLGGALASKDQLEAARRLREALATYQQSEDLVQLGAYVSGSNPKLDAAIRARPKLIEFLRQDAGQKAPLEDTVSQMNALARSLE